MVLFVCRGDCESCQESERCPIKPEMQSAKDSFLVERFGSTLMTGVWRNMISEFTCENIVRILRPALFKLIQLLLIEREEEGCIQLSKESIQARVEEIFPEKIRLAFEKFHRGDPGTKNNPLTKKILLILIPEIAEKIEYALRGKCNRKCSRCVLEEQCPISLEA